MTDAVSLGRRPRHQIRRFLASSIAKKARILYREASDLCDPANNSRLGLLYLSWLSSIFKSTSEILLAYNIGHNRAKRYLSHAGDANNLYIRRVLDEYQRYKTSLPAI